jgi:hypothetical protein
MVIKLRSTVYYLSNQTCPEMSTRFLIRIPMTVFSKFLVWSRLRSTVLAWSVEMCRLDCKVRKTTARSREWVNGQIMNSRSATKEHSYSYECHRQPPSAFRTSIRALFTKARISSSNAERSGSGQFSSPRLTAAAASNCESVNSSSNS